MTETNMSDKSMQNEKLNKKKLKKENEENNFDYNGNMVQNETMCQDFNPSLNRIVLNGIAISHTQPSDRILASEYHLLSQLRDKSSRFAPPFAISPSRCTPKGVRPN